MCHMYMYIVQWIKECVKIVVNSEKGQLGPKVAMFFRDSTSLTTKDVEHTAQ